MAAATIDHLIALHKAQCDLRSDEALMNSLHIDAQTLAAVRARARTLPNMAMVKIAESTGHDLITVMAVSHLALAQLSEQQSEFWLQYID